MLDGEVVGDTFHAFDLLTIGPEDMRPLGFSVRYLRMRDMLKAFDHPHIHLVEVVFPFETAGRLQQFKQEDKEGEVFKHKDAPHTPGHPNSGGRQLKFKFHETASLIVTKVNDKRSVSLILFEGEKVRPAGNVIIPPNHDLPAPGTVVECRYLYAFKEFGGIYQPVYQGLRPDIRAAECTTCQLKYKAGAEIQHHNPRSDPGIFTGVRACFRATQKIIPHEDHYSSRHPAGSLRTARPRSQPSRNCGRSSSSSCLKPKQPRSNRKKPAHNPNHHAHEPHFTAHLRN